MANFTQTGYYGCCDIAIHDARTGGSPVVQRTKESVQDRLAKIAKAPHKGTHMGPQLCTRMNVDKSSGLIKTVTTLDGQTIDVSGLKVTMAQIASDLGVQVPSCDQVLPYLQKVADQQAQEEAAAQAGPLGHPLVKVGLLGGAALFAAKLFKFF